MEAIITKQESKEIAQIKGKIRGVGIKNIADFVLKEEGEDGLALLQSAITQVGFPVEYKSMRDIGFYPLRLLHVTLIAIKKLFDWPDEQFQEMGIFQVKTSMIIRLFSKYLLSLEKAAQEVQTMWDTYFTVGSLEIIELDKEKKQGKLRLEDFPLHPLHAQFLCGYFPTILQMIVKSEVNCRQVPALEDQEGVFYFVLEWQ
ncbi:MAG: hypothetical protein GF370_00590 [Candidatus Nealsonbacteria bacterium]|nr:hypothetical protein [Candidatus Nealsonbacteria bacterium]